MCLKLLEQNLDKIDWYMLSQNPNAIHLLEQNPKKVRWWRLSKNPNDNSKVEDEVRKQVVSLCSSFPIYKNLRK